MAITTLNKPAKAQAFIDARIAEGSNFIKTVMEDCGTHYPMNTLELASVKLAVVHIRKLANARAA